jgi:hypothetical protein
MRLGLFRRVNHQYPTHFARSEYLFHPRRSHRSQLKETSKFESTKKTLALATRVSRAIYTHTPAVRGGVATWVWGAMLRPPNLSPLAARMNCDVGGFAGAGGARC